MGLYEHIVCSGPPGLGDQAVRRETQASRVGEGEKEWGAEAPHPSSTQGAPAGLPAASRGRCALAAPHPHTEGLEYDHHWGQQRLRAAFKHR